MSEDRSGLSFKMFDRWMRFVGSRVERARMVALDAVRPIDEQEVEPGGKPLLSLAEVAVPRDPPDAPAREHLALVTVSGASLDGAGLAFGLEVFLPDTLRGYRRETPEMICFNDLPLGRAADGITDIAVLFYAIARSPRTDHLMADLQRFVEARRHAPQAEQALSLTQPVLDRIEVLEASGDSALVLAGEVESAGLEDVAGAAVPYWALVRADAAAAGTRGWVRGSSLHLGDTADGAVPAAGGGHLLIRHGPRSTRRDMRRFIDELRQRHAMRRGELQAAEEGEDYDSYVTAELARQRKEVIDALYGEHVMLPVVTPLAIEYAADLGGIVALGADPPTPFQLAAEAAMKVMLRDYGVSITKPRLRANDTDMPPGSYLFMLDEIPIVMGTIDPGKLFCGATVETLRAHGIAANPATNPADGTEGAFIPADSGDAARAAGTRVWSPGEYVALHLDGLLRGNLGLFAGSDAIWQALGAPENLELLAQLGTAPGGLARFRAAVLALLAERLPMAPLPEIALRYLELVDRPVFEITEELRLIAPVNRHLLRDADAWRVFHLAPEIAALLDAGVLRDGDLAALAIPPEPTQEVLSAVRAEIGAQSRKGSDVILVEDWRLRPFVRRLVELEFPAVRVVARREVEALDAAALAPVAVIALDA